MQRIGLFGGTFDPIHYGHLAIAEEFCWSLHLSQVIIIPTGYQPLKRGDHAASAHHRLAMTRVACRTNPSFTVSDIEIQRPPPSYTLDTLHTMRTHYGNNIEWWFLLGADAVAHFPRWHEPERILQLAHLAVIYRPGSSLCLDTLERALPGITQRIHVIEGPRLAISSTNIRHRLAHAQPVRYHMPDDVIDYIETYQLYRHATA